MKVITSLIVIILLALSSNLFAENPVINSILAVVEDKPITIEDINKLFHPRKNYTLHQIKNNQDALRALNTIILREVITLEATSRRISVSDGEIDLYIAEVAKRNNLSMNEFKKALEKENRSYESYKEEVRTEILKTRIAGKMLQEGVAVSGKDLKDYLEKRPDLNNEGTKYKLRQILIANSGKSPQELEAIYNGTKKSLGEGAEFSALAKRLSNGPEARQGGLLGIVAEEDLNPLITEAIEDLREGEISKLVSSPAGYHIFFLEKRYEQDSDEISPELKKDLEDIIKQQEVSKKIDSFFSSELLDKYTVDRRI